MLKLGTLLAVVAAGLMASEASTDVTEASPTSVSGEVGAVKLNPAAVLCESGVCIQADGWICADSPEPDPEEVLWDYCNGSQGEDPYEWGCELPE